MKRILQFLVISVFLNACSREWDNSLGNKFPDVITLDASEISFYTVILSGSVLNEGGSFVIESGICYSTSQNPTIENNKIILASGSGVFGGTVSGLEANTKYFVRAYAINDNGTSYGNQISFTTLSILQIEGLISYYPFNGNANDESGNENHGTVIGGTSVKDFLIIRNNSVDRVSIPYNIINGLSDFTCAGKLKINTMHTSGTTWPLNTWIHGWTTSEDNVFSIHFFKNSSSRWGIHINGPVFYFQSNTIIEDWNWHHITIQRNGSTARLFIDGIEIGNGISVNNKPIVINPNMLVLGQEMDLNGSFDMNQSWAGEMDNIRIYNRPLTREEIHALYQMEGLGN